MYRRRPQAGVGLKLGAEGRVIDLDVDDPDAAARRRAAESAGRELDRAWTPRRRKSDTLAPRDANETTDRTE
jgi:hypothetical protein